MVRALILFSGGLDSTVMLALALSQKKACLLTFFAYGQRHLVELEAAKKIATFYQLPLHIIQLPTIGEGHSTLIGRSPIEEINLSSPESFAKGSTYVPARNTIFLAYAASLAEIWQADEIHFGCNLMDVTNYPDCRPAYVDAFQRVLHFATKQASEGSSPHLMTPLKDLDKKGIFQLGKKLDAPLTLTWSCYNPQRELPCEECDACLLRKGAFS